MANATPVTLRDFLVREFRTYCADRPDLSLEAAFRSQRPWADTLYAWKYRLSVAGELGDAEKAELLEQFFKLHLATLSDEELFDHVEYGELEGGSMTMKFVARSATETPERPTEPGPMPVPRNYPSYHDMLNHLCSELGVPGSPTFHQAVEQVKGRLATRP